MSTTKGTICFTIAGHHFRFDKPHDPTYGAFHAPAVKGFQMAPKDDTVWAGHFQIGEDPPLFWPEEKLTEYRKLNKSSGFSAFCNEENFYLTRRFQERNQLLAEVNLQFTSGIVYPHAKTADTHFRDGIVWPTRPEIIYSRLAYLDVAVLHSSHVHVDGKSIIFTGRSGSGKSTAGNLWVAAGHQLRNDETNVLYLDGDTAMCGSTPWHGEIPFFEPGDHPLAGIFFLNQAPENRLERISPPRASAMILANLLTPRYYKPVYEKVMPVAAAIAARVPAYILHCTADHRAVDVVKQELLANSSHS